MDLYILEILNIREMGFNNFIFSILLQMSSSSQVSLKNHSIGYGVYLIAGYPGTGKTSVKNSIASMFEKHQIISCSPRDVFSTVDKIANASVGTTNITSFTANLQSRSLILVDDCDDILTKTALIDWRVLKQHNITILWTLCLGPQLFHFQTEHINYLIYPYLEETRLPSAGGYVHHLTDGVALVKNLSSGDIEKLKYDYVVAIPGSATIQCTVNTNVIATTENPLAQTSMQIPIETDITTCRSVVRLQDVVDPTVTLKFRSCVKFDHVLDHVIRTDSISDNIVNSKILVDANKLNMREHVEKGWFTSYTTYHYAIEFKTLPCSSTLALIWDPKVLPLLSDIQMVSSL